VETVFLAEDVFAQVVDEQISFVSSNPQARELGDTVMMMLNNFLQLDNPVLGKGLDALQAAINANPMLNTQLGMLAEFIGHNAAADFIDMLAAQLG
jgi:hypothetical protein